MKYLFNFFLLVVFIQGQLHAVGVRVLLARSANPTWHLVGEAGFYLQDPQTDKRVAFGDGQTQLTITQKNGKLLINGRACSCQQVYLMPFKRHVLVDGYYYDGFFIVTKHEKEFLLINVIDSEEYVYSVLKAEGWPGWPLEINKVLAVTCRSYVFHRMTKARKQEKPYDIKNTNHHQRYNGIHTCAVIRQAIEETQGLFLAHEREPILAMFDICCGGVVPCHIKGAVDFQKAPYLARPYPCTFCRECKSFNWQVDYSFEQLRRCLQEGAQEFLHDLKDFKVIRNEKAGVVEHAVAKTTRAEMQFSAQECLKLLKGIKSHAFHAKKKAKKVTFKGTGFGHHLGLCQWGAREMVRQGWSFHSILQFFYPGTTFMRLAKYPPRSEKHST